MSIKVVSEDDVIELLTPEISIKSQRDAFTCTSDTPSRLILTRHLPGPTLIKPSTVILNSKSYSGTKIVSVRPSQPDTVPATVLMMDPVSGAVTHAIEGGVLTAIRTAAGSAVATRAAFGGEAVRLVIVGAGRQGREHARCLMWEYRGSITDVYVINRSLGRAEGLCGDLMEERKGWGEVGEQSVRFHKAKLEDQDAVKDALSQASVVCLCTNSDQPIFPSSYYPPNCHLNAVGGFTPSTREVDAEFLKIARAIVVDTEEALKVGDLLQGEAEVKDDVKAKIKTLPDLLNGGGGEREGGITFFKSVGWAAQDIAAGAYLIEELAKRDGA